MTKLTDSMIDLKIPSEFKLKVFKIKDIFVRPHFVIIVERTAYELPKKEIVKLANAAIRKDERVELFVKDIKR